MTRLQTLNLPGFHRQFIGFERLFDEMDRVFENTPNNGSGGYPPYNIAKLNEDEFMISLAVAGFAMDDLSIEKDKDVLKIEGSTPKGDEDVNYVQRGIAGRNFVREFNLAEHVDVKSAKLENGMLNVHLVRDVPEEMKPKKIKIVSDLTIEG